MSMATHILAFKESHIHDDPIELRMEDSRAGKLQIEQAGLHAPNPIVSRMARG